MAISPQTPERNAEVKSKHRLEFPVLADAGNAWARSLSLAWAFPDDLRELYGAFGISLPDFNGDDSWELPMSARIVVDRSGVVRGIDADADYARRPEPEATIEVLREIA